MRCTGEWGDKGREKGPDACLLSFAGEKNENEAGWGAHAAATSAQRGAGKRGGKVSRKKPCQTQPKKEGRSESEESSDKAA